MIKSFNIEKWLVFVVSLPTANTTLRMRMWRSLKGLGCAVLRDGVYLLPAGRGLRQSLRVQAEEIRSAGGHAYLLNVASSSSEEKHHFQGMFDRSAEYRELMDKTSALRKELSALDNLTARRKLKVLRRELEALIAVDYFPTPLQAEAEDCLAEVETSFLASLTPREAGGTDGAIMMRDHQTYRERIWTSRKPLSTDALASAWLIQRFIDPAAQFVWLEDTVDFPATSVSFASAGAEFHPLAGLSSFALLAASFGLDEDQALAPIAAITQALAAGGRHAAEAAGVEMILNGARRRCADDAALLALATATFDCLYAAQATG